MLKRELRKIYIEKRKTLPAEERKLQDERIAERFFANFDLSRISFLHCYLPIEKFSEIDTKIIFERIRREFPHIETLVPRVDFETGEMESLRFTPETALIQNRWQIDEPTHGETVEAAQIDLVLVPLLCFDERGYRVGYGKGYYDRLLQNCRADCLKIGLSYFAPIARIEDIHEFDAKLDFGVTPENVWRF